MAVKEVVDLVAVDDPIAMVHSVIPSFNKVSGYRCRKMEHFVSFVDRFRGLAPQHLIQAGFESSTHIQEALAITLINNANFRESTLHKEISSYSRRLKPEPSRE